MLFCRVRFPEGFTLELFACSWPRPSRTSGELLSRAPNRIRNAQGRAIFAILRLGENQTTRVSHCLDNGGADSLPVRFGRFRPDPQDLLWKGPGRSASQQKFLEPRLRRFRSTLHVCNCKCDPKERRSSAFGKRAWILIDYDLWNTSTALWERYYGLVFGVSPLLGYLYCISAQLAMFSISI